MTEVRATPSIDCAHFRKGCETQLRKVDVGEDYTLDRSQKQPEILQRTGKQPTLEGDRPLQGR